MINRLNIVRKRYSNYKNGYYGEKLNELNSSDFFMNLLKKYNEQQKLVTKKEIYFSEKIRFGCNVKNIKHKMRTPTYSVSSSDAMNCKILFYKIIVGNHKANLNMFLHHSKLFLYNLTFLYLTDQEKNEILNIIQHKYLEQQPIDFSTQSIIDELGNCIQIDDVVNLKINYFSYKADFFKEISDKAASEKLKGIKKISTRYSELYRKL